MSRVINAALTLALCVGSWWFGQLYYHNRWGHTEPPPVVAVGKAPPQVVGESLTGATRVLDLASRRQPVILLVLSTDCRFCQENLPNWRALIEEFEGMAPLEVIVLSLSSPDATASYLEDNGLDVPAMLIGGTELADLGLRGVPGTVGISRGAAEARTWMGVLDEGERSAILAWAASALDAAN